MVLILEGFYINVLKIPHSIESKVLKMKFGVRKPSYKRRLSARAKGKAKRRMKKAIKPMYGKKGIGWVGNPKKAAYNKVYRKTTTGCLVPFLIFSSFLLGLL